MGLFLRSPHLQGDRTDLPASQGEQAATRLVEEGNSAEDAGRLVEALASYDAAVRAFPDHARAHLNRGNALARLGRHDEALAAYHEALARKPDYAGAYTNIGNLQRQRGHAEESIASYRRALEIDPGAANVHFTVAMALEEIGRVEEAAESYRRAVIANDGFVEAHANLGNVLLALERPDEALSCYERAARLRPSIPEVRYGIANALFVLGRHEESIAAFERAIEQKPTFAAASVGLGKAQRAMGRLADAIASLRRALPHEPESFECQRNLGLALRDIGQGAEALILLESALRSRPRDAATHTDMGVTLHLLGRIEEAIACHRHALDVDPAFVEARNNLANAQKDLGRFEEAIAEYRGVLRARPHFWAAHSNLLLAMNYSCGDLTACLDGARDFGRALAAATPRPFTSWSATKRPERLRVGLVSGDLRAHPVGYFLEGMLARCRDTRLELIAYPTFGAEDELTARMRPAFTAWRPLVGLSDEAAARLIRDDGVHVLLDPAGHTAHNRLPIFAWKPAPVQASWLGYFATTGVEGMDYVLGDPYVAPASEEGHFTETVWRLPDCYLCFTPPAFALEVSPLPALAAGHVTFGCFNNLAKVTNDVVRLWARVLREVPTARLLLKTVQLVEPGVRETTYQRFETAGLPRDRLLLDPPSPRTELLAAYNRVDIALDPFPYPGGTTTAEAYWMGVPTITRKGDRFLSHVGESIAHAAGMPDWIAIDDNDYVTKAVAFASDLDRLTQIRTSLRQQVLASPLFDANRYARAFEAAVWGMWEKHVNQAGTQ